MLLIVIKCTDDLIMEKGIAQIINDKRIDDTHLLNYNRIQISNESFDISISTNESNIIKCQTI